MNKIKGFLKMKYEQYMIRKLDRLADAFFKNENLKWYLDNLAVTVYFSKPKEEMKDICIRHLKDLGYEVREIEQEE